MKLTENQIRYIISEFFFSSKACIRYPGIMEERYERKNMHMFDVYWQGVHGHPWQVCSACLHAILNETLNYSYNDARTEETDFDLPSDSVYFEAEDWLVASARTLGCNVTKLSVKYFSNGEPIHGRTKI